MQKCASIGRRFRPAQSAQLTFCLTWRGAGFADFLDGFVVCPDIEPAGFQQSGHIGWKRAVQRCSRPGNAHTGVICRTGDGGQQMQCAPAEYGRREAAGRADSGEPRLIRLRAAGERRQPCKPCLSLAGRKSKRSAETVAERPVVNQGKKLLNARLLRFKRAGCQRRAESAGCRRSSGSARQPADAAWAGGRRGSGGNSRGSARQKKRHNRFQHAAAACRPAGQGRMTALRPLKNGKQPRASSFSMTRQGAAARNRGAKSKGSVPYFRGKCKQNLRNDGQKKRV